MGRIMSRADEHLLVIEEAALQSQFMIILISLQFRVRQSNYHYQSHPPGVVSKSMNLIVNEFQFE